MPPTAMGYNNSALGGKLLSERKIGSQSEKTKPKNNHVRRFANGILDVERKTGEYVKIIEKNARAPLLCLPAEIRNEIWQMALGGNVFRVWVKNGRLYSTNPREPEKPFEGEPNLTLALLQTCRQIYAEAVCYPARYNEFEMSVSRRNTSRQVLPQYFRDNLTTIRLKTFMIPRWIATTVNCALLPEVSFVESLANLRHVIIAVHGYASQTNLDRYEQMIEEGQQLLLQRYTRKRKDIEIILEETMLDS